jgi:hypothetical protein
MFLLSFLRKSPTCYQSLFLRHFTSQHTIGSNVYGLTLKHRKINYGRGCGTDYLITAGPRQHSVSRFRVLRDSLWSEESCIYAFLYTIDLDWKRNLLLVSTVGRQVQIDGTRRMRGPGARSSYVPEADACVFWAMKLNRIFTAAFEKICFWGPCVGTAFFEVGTFIFPGRRPMMGTKYEYKLDVSSRPGASEADIETDRQTDRQADCIPENKFPYSAALKMCKFFRTSSWSFSLPCMHVRGETRRDTCTQWTDVNMLRRSVAAARVGSQVRWCATCGGQSDIGAGFLRLIRFPLPILIARTAPPKK